MFLEHVNLTVADLERSIAFYRDVLGLRVRWRGTSSDGQRAAHVGDGRCYLTFFEAGAGAGAAEMDYDRVGFNHFGFVVESLDEARRRLQSVGVTPHFAADYEPGARLYFMDPDGIEIELVQYASPAESVAVQGEAS